MKPDANTTTFAVLGHPVSHSLSPAMHNASLRALGLNAIYLAYDVREQDVPTAIKGMCALGFGGTNVTIPLKHAAYACMDHLAPCAKRLGVVNTVAYRDGETTGYNTDGVGLLADLREQFGLHPRGLKTLVLGCGGAGRAVALTMAAEGAAQIMLANRTPARAAELADDVRAAGATSDVRVLPDDAEAWIEASLESDLVIQCTSSGMRSDEHSLLPARAFRRDQCVYDLIYTQERTSLLHCAAATGARIANGLGMLLHQGAESFHIWTGQRADTHAMRVALQEAVHGRQI